MRAVKIYSFKIGTKIPFSEWPGIVDQYLQEQGLDYKKFCYYFCADNDSRDKTACHKALKDCANLGTVMMNKSHSTVYLTNIGMDAGATKEEIMPLMGKIYRRYGFTDTYLIYQDVDFFGKLLAAMEQHGPLYCRYFGSLIRLYRDRYDTQWNGIELLIDILHDGEIYDAQPYRDAMQKLLPGMKCTERFAYVLEPSDEELYEKLNQSAVPFFEAARMFFEDNPPLENEAGAYGSVSTAAILKKLCRKYKYKYVGCEYYVYTVWKKTGRGHYIVLEYISGPSGKGLDVCIGFQGLGFNRQIAYLQFAARNQETVEDAADQLFELLKAAELTVLADLDSHYPPTPDWFVPSEID